MMRTLATATVLLLAACAPAAGPTTVMIPPPAPLPVPPVPAPPPVIEPVEPTIALDLEDGLPSPATAACMSAVGERAGDLNVSVLGSEPVAAGTEITIGVGQARTPWRCVAGPSGDVVEVAEVGA